LHNSSRIGQPVNRSSLGR